MDRRSASAGWWSSAAVGRCCTASTATCPTGRVTGLLGPSGGGKTTFMRCVVGVQRVAAGR